MWQHALSLPIFVATSPTSPLFFSFHHTATTQIYTLSLHDALPIWYSRRSSIVPPSSIPTRATPHCIVSTASNTRSEEHTSELQSRENLVCRLLLEKKKIII